MSTGAWILLAAVAAIAVWAVVAYNALVGLRNRVDEAWSGIDVQLNRRHDLVPNLVETVRGYAEHERATLEATTRARARALAVAEADPPRVAAAESDLTGALGAVRGLAEGYPELRASDSFQHLAAELAEIEDEIQASRRIYNSNVQRLNTRCQTLPDALIARLGGFAPRQYFEIAVPAERAVPPVLSPA